MAANDIIANILKGEKLDDDNYDIWHRNIQYLFNANDMSTIFEENDPRVESPSDEEK